MNLTVPNQKTEVIGNGKELPAAEPLLQSIEVVSV
jgi:hypothetical protein